VLLLLFNSNLKRTFFQRPNLSVGSPDPGPAKHVVHCYYLYVQKLKSNYDVIQIVSFTVLTAS